MKRTCLCILLLLLLSACGGKDASASAAVPSQTASPLPAADSAPQTLTVARMENNRFVTEAIYNFNQASEDYTLESQWYTNQAGELRLALVAGAGPDLMSLDMFDYELYAGKGVFADLYPYLDSDPDLSRDDLVTSVLTAMEWSDGALYQLAPTYYIQNMYTCPGTLDASDWSLDAIEAWMDAHPSALFTADSQDPMDLMSLLLQGYLPALVDFDTMTCDFTSGLFTRLMEDSQAWASRQWDYGELDAGAFSSGSLLAAWLRISDFSGWETNTAMGITNSVGFPSADSGQVFVGSVIRFAICAGTGHEDQAWDFLKTTLSPELQAEVPWFPLLKSALDAQAQEALQETPPTVTEQYVDPQGAANGTNMAVQTMTLPPVSGLSQPQVDAVYDMIRQVSGTCGNTYVEIWTILYEELPAYFADGRPATDVAAVIQNRTQIYLSEHT